MNQSSNVNGKAPDTTGMAVQSDICGQRTKLQQVCQLDDEPHLAQLVLDCFKQDDTVRAYFAPKRLPIMVLERGARSALHTGRTVKAVPFKQVGAAIAMATSLEIVQPCTPHQKKLLALATLLQPLSLFLLAYRPGDQSASWQLRHIRGRVLFMPLRKLLEQDLQSANLLATLLGFTTKHDLDPALLARLGTALCLANLSIRSTWGCA